MVIFFEVKEVCFSGPNLSKKVIKLVNQYRNRFSLTILNDLVSLKISKVFSRPKEKSASFSVSKLNDSVRHCFK